MQWLGLKRLFAAFKYKASAPRSIPIVEARRSSSGIDYLFLNAPSDGTVALSFAFKGGIFDDRAGEPPTAFVAPVALIQEAVSGHDGLSSEEALIDMGGALALVPRPLEIVGLASAPTATARDVFASLQHLLTLSEVSAASREKAIQVVRSNIENGAKHTESQTQISALRALVGPDPMLAALTPSPDTVGEVQTADILTWRDRHIVKARLVASVAGQTDGESADKFIDDVFSALPAGQTAEMHLPPLQTRTEAQVIEMGEGNSPQAFVAISSMELRPTKPSDFLAAHLASHILAGDEQSRLFKAIRQVSKATYGLRCTPEVDAVSISMSIAGAIDREQRHSVVEQIRAVVRGLATEGPTPGEMSRAKAILNQYHGEILLNTQAAASQISALQCAGWSADDINGVKDLIAGIQPEEIATLLAPLSRHPVIVVNM